MQKGWIMAPGGCGELRSVDGVFLCFFLFLLLFLFALLTFVYIFVCFVCFFPVNSVAQVVCKLACWFVSPFVG